MRHFLVDILPWEQEVWVVAPTQLSLSQYARYRWWKTRTFKTLYRLARPNWYAFLSHQGRWVSMLEIVERQARVGTQEVRLGLIGAVTTVPRARGRGYASELLRKSVQFLRDQRSCEFAWLMCGEGLIGFYERLGWQRVEGGYRFDQPGGTVRGELAAMVFPCQAASWPEGELDLCGFPI